MQKKEIISSPTTLRRLWLMDQFGYMIHYRAGYLGLIRRPFQEGAGLPNLFLLIPYPLKYFPFLTCLRTVNKIPSNVPPIALIDAGRPFIGIEAKGEPGFLSINPRTIETHWNGNELLNWEKFLPLTQEMIQGIACLTDKDIAVVRQNGQTLSPLTFGDAGENAADVGYLGHLTISLSKNLSQFTLLGQLKPSEEVEICFLNPQSGKLPPCRILRKEEARKVSDSGLLQHDRSL